MGRAVNGRLSVRAHQVSGNISFKLTFSVADTKRELNAYLEDLKESEVRSLAEIIDYNLKHAEKELPSRENTANHQNLVCGC